MLLKLVKRLPELPLIRNRMICLENASSNESLIFYLLFSINLKCEEWQRVSAAVLWNSFTCIFLFSERKHFKFAWRLPKGIFGAGAKFCLLLVAFDANNLFRYCAWSPFGAVIEWEDVYSNYWSKHLPNAIQTRGLKPTTACLLYHSHRFWKLRIIRQIRNQRLATELKPRCKASATLL